MSKFYILGVIFLKCVLCDVTDVKILSAWRDFPVLLLNATSVEPKCREAFDTYLNLLRDNDLSALKMLDATAKIPSGVLNGNIIQYGDFNECMEVETAQYCLAEIDLEPLWKEPYSQFKNLVHSFYFFKEDFHDPAHRIPGFRMVRWGFCIPRECSAKDLEASLEKNFGFNVHIRDGMCQKAVKSGREWTYGDYIARIFFAVIFFAVALSTIIDFWNTKNKNEENEGMTSKILMSFSMRKNINDLFDVEKSNKNEIAGLDGIRALNVLALLMSHKAVSLFFSPYMNRTPTVDRLSKPWTIIAKNAIVYTDTFMLLSGLLNANALLNDLKIRQQLNFKDKLVNRIFRILPNIVALILFCTYILPSMGSGPLWPTIVDHHAVLCKKYMWRNIFFIHNYFGFENMCLTHTHQLGIDMQLFLITPVIVYFVWTRRNLGFFMLFMIGLISTILRFWVVYENELSSVIYFGVRISKMFAMANLSYILPTHRATIYLIGVYLAFFMKNLKTNTEFSRIHIATLWVTFLPIFIATWVGPYHMVLKEYVYNKFEASFLNAVYPIFWGASVSFGIYAVNQNIAGWFGTFLCWKYFKVVTKLAYAIYLVQFPVFFYNVGVTKHVDEYQPYYQLQVLETTAIILCSFLLVLFVEMPFQNIKKVLFEKKNITKKGNMPNDRIKHKKG